MENRENYLAWVTTMEGVRYAVTNSNGEATFRYLSAWDISGNNSTFKILFGAGDNSEGMFITTEPTETNYTFILSFKFEMEQQPCKFISAYQDFQQSPVIRATVYTQRYMILMSAQLTQIFNRDFRDTYLGATSNKYMDRTTWLCNS